MNKYLICGIQQIGIGVSNLEEAWKWYVKHFGMDCRIFEDNSEAKLMLKYTGGEPRKRHAILAMNLQSGGGFEIWQYAEREPVAIKEEIKIGDLGIIACKIKSKNPADTLEIFNNEGLNVPGHPLPDPAGSQNFFMKDPFGNLFQVVEAGDWFMEEKKSTGGSFGAVIGVSNIERSLNVYSDILGYDEIVYDKAGIFPDLAKIAGGDKECRRVLLRRSKKFTGPISKLFGNSVIELIASAVPGKKIYSGRLWGDPGFIHLCYDIQGMEHLERYCEEKGFPFTVDSKNSHNGNSFDMGEAAGHFSYIEDPDSTLIEFVETHKIPIIKKLGLYIDLKKREQGKPLPVWMLKSLRFSRVRK